MRWPGPGNEQKLLRQASGYVGKTAQRALIGQAGPSSAPPSPSQTLFPVTVLPKNSICSPAKAAPQPPISPLPSCTLLQLLPFPSRPPYTSLNMFRNALRQSTRAVGAVSAAGRVAAVSLPSSPEPSANAIDSRPDLSGKRLQGSIGSPDGVYTSFELLFGAVLALDARCSAGGPLRRASANLFFPRSEMPHLAPSTSRLDPTPPTPRPRRLRSRPFSSSEFAVSMRSPASLRPAVSFPSGMWSFGNERRAPGPFDVGDSTSFNSHHNATTWGAQSGRATC